MTSEPQNDLDRQARRARIDAVREERGLTTLRRLFDRVIDLAGEKWKQEKSGSSAHAAYGKISKWVEDDFYKCLGRGHSAYNECLDLICEVFAKLDPVNASLADKIESYRQRIWLGETGQRPHAAELPAAAAPALQESTAPSGWAVIDRNFLQKVRDNPPSNEVIIKFFDGILPTWRFALARGVQPRAVAGELADRLRALHDGAAKPAVILLKGAGGEGKSTAILHSAAALIDDKKQAWTCLYRQAANAPLPEDALLNLPVRPDHAWVVVVDDADNIGASILAAVKKIATRIDVHVLMCAREIEWDRRRLLHPLWQPFAHFHAERLKPLDENDASRIVSGWAAWGPDAMGKLKGKSEKDAAATLLRYSRNLAARQEKGELLGALLLARQGEDMRAHVRTLIQGISRDPVIGEFSLRKIYTMIVAMHAENQLYLSRSVLSFALGCEVEELDSKALVPLQSEAALLDSGDVYVLSRHRRIAEAACAVIAEDDGESEVAKCYPFLAAAALRHARAGRETPEIYDWRINLVEHFVKKDRRHWPTACAIARSLYDTEPNDGHRLTVYSDALRRTGQPLESMRVLKAAGERFRSDRAFLYDWSTVAGAVGDSGLDCWLASRSMADGGASLSAKQCKLSLAGLSAAFRELSGLRETTLFTRARAACGMLGLRLPEIDAKAVDIFEKEMKAADIANLSSQRAVDLMRMAVIEGVKSIKADDGNPAYFKKLIGDPGGYRYNALLRWVSSTKSR